MKLSSAHFLPHRIAILGAESTGKSTLAHALAAQLNGVLVPEYLREFCDAHGRPPLQYEQASIADEQIRREQQAGHRARAQGLSWVVCDPGPLMTAIYSLYYFNDASLLPAALSWQRSYATTLVCQADIAWEQDGFLRDGPEVRTHIQTLIHHTLDAEQLPWLAIHGQGEQRTTNALSALLSAADRQANPWCPSDRDKTAPIAAHS